MSKKTLIFIGNGMATNRVLENLGMQHPFDEIHIFSDENIAHYNRIMLSPLLAGETTLQAITPHTADWYQAMKAQIHLNNPVIAINHQQQTVTTKNGEQVTYDALVIATGSRSFIPDLPGSDGSNVVGFRAMHDVDIMVERLATLKHATVIGAGLLGVEAAVGLRLQGINVTLIHRNPVIMNRQLDATAASLLQHELTQRGIDVRTGWNPVSIEHNQDQDSTSTVTLDNGLQSVSLPTDLIVFATGITPNTEPAISSGLNCNKGIQVNARMQTSADNIFALGECCEFDGNTYGLVAPIWDQASVVADELRQLISESDDNKQQYTEREHLTKLKVSGLDIHSIGQFEEDNDTEVLHLLDRDSGIYKKVLLKNDRVIGALCVGDVTDSHWYYELMSTNTPVHDIRTNLVFGKAYC